VTLIFASLLFRGTDISQAYEERLQKELRQLEYRNAREGDRADSLVPAAVRYSVEEALETISHRLQRQLEHMQDDQRSVSAALRDLPDRNEQFLDRLGFIVGQLEHRSEAKLSPPNAVHQLVSSDLGTEQTVRQIADRLVAVVEGKLGTFQRSTAAVVVPSAQVEQAGLVSIRELYHQLLTPLAQIEANSTLLERQLARIPSGETISPEISRKASAIRASAELCKTLLAAYRGSSLFVVRDGEGRAASLSDAIRAAIEVYASGANKTIQAIVQLADEPGEYSVDFVIALLVPLIENAIAAAPDNTSVFVGGERRDGAYRITQTNSVSEAPVISRFFQAGYSTKNEHEGLGLSIARRLVEMQREAKIEVSFDGRLVAFRVTLPLREARS
jgi:signal transduction histidine kinase